MQDQIKIRESVAKKILNYMKTGNTITAMEAMQKFGCMRLAARMHQLRNDGHIIESTPKKSETNGKIFSEYRLVKEA